MTGSNLLRIIKLYIRATRAYRYAVQQEIPGIEFAHYGRQLGKRLLRQGDKSGFTYLVRPVEITRYFEFSFALECLLAAKPAVGLDVSSPRLFSFYAGEQGLIDSLVMINPDASDIGRSQEIVSALNMRNITLEDRDVASLANDTGCYDCIWSISVVEHIAADSMDDSAAMKPLIGALKSGGRLIITVPVDQTHWNEYRQIDPYGTQEKEDGEGYFFQRFYTKDTIKSRLLAPLNLQATKSRWFGEKEAGIFHAYINRWRRDGLEATVNDPWEIGQHYREYPSWEAMPGVGVCGLEIVKGD